MRVVTVNCESTWPGLITNINTSTTASILPLVPITILPLAITTSHVTTYPYATSYIYQA